MIYVGGLLYGTADGAPGDFGAVFSITPSGTLTTLHSFHGTDGSNGQAPLLNVGGTFYSTTEGGGLNGYGTVYSITP
jgi:uncharacterized repeat protein (TIGR03803 family)